MSAVTLTDVARRAGVSQPTASRVLNGSTRKPAAHVVEAVRKAADELGYIPNAQAQALARAATGCWGCSCTTSPTRTSRPSPAVCSAPPPGSSGRCCSRSPRAAPPWSWPAWRRSWRTAPTRSSWSAPGGPPRRRPSIADRLTSVLTRYKVNGGRLAVIGQPIPGASAVVPDNKGAAPPRWPTPWSPAVCGSSWCSADRTGWPPRPTGSPGSAAALDGHGLQPRAVLHGAFTRDGGYDAARQAIARCCRRHPGRCASSRSTT